MPSDPQYRKIKAKLRELEIELSKAGFKGPLSKLTDIQRDIDALYMELGPKCIGGGTPAKVVSTALRGANIVKAQRVTGKIFRPRKTVNV